MKYIPSASTVARLHVGQSRNSLHLPMNQHQKGSDYVFVVFYCYFIVIVQAVAGLGFT